ncbi:RluA family pseudouridine synthase [Salinispirillum sp. LH 10-3-1]|uniref:RluA family pseudouridine synthase n=1 Tax=Salinispirillum sp. LH 10-3-1 TaxID=2952525 RepID=A0AB38YD39_9GAMM
MKIDVALQVESVDSLVAIDFLVDNVNLSKSRLKKTMNAGAVWLVREGESRRRLRRAMTDLKVGDVLQIYYDETILDQHIRPMIEVADFEWYSVWYKQAGMLSQGTDWGDQNSVMRQVELHFKNKREVFLVHRLDREAKGLMVIAHQKRAAAALSELFREGKIKKEYRIEVLGDLRAEPEGNIELPLDEKASTTRYKLEKYNEPTNTSTLNVWIETGRKHQIRRHFAAIGHPVMGDPAYGEGNKQRSGLMLEAVALSFECPFTGEARDFTKSAIEAS